MEIRNSKIVLTINLEGCHKPRFVENKKSGKIIRIFTEKGSKSLCKKVVNLSEEFTNYSISNDGYPSKDKNMNSKRWRKMSNKQKLEYHLKEIVKHENVVPTPENYSYEILS